MTMLNGDVVDPTTFQIALLKFTLGDFRIFENALFDAERLRTFYPLADREQLLRLLLCEFQDDYSSGMPSPVFSQN
jgi:hypothetical protein